MARVIKLEDAGLYAQCWLHQHEGVKNPSRDGCYCGEYLIMYEGCSDPNHCAYRRTYRCGNFANRYTKSGKFFACGKADVHATHIMRELVIEGECWQCELLLSCKT
ncbi:hypothetical protein EV127DRAFT_405907 [Xylaria flabelliformis]|nr:hypothetical protein EV127DRAFT_405907 [Xylaria flabelliformis]